MKLNILQSHNSDMELYSDEGLTSERSDSENNDSVEVLKAVGKRGKISSKRDYKKLKLAKYTKQPSVDELNRLRETENLFNSNLFRLQIEELLKEVEVKSKYVYEFNKWLDKFNDFLSNLKDDISHDIFDQSWLNETKVKVPMIQKPLETKGIFKFIKCSPATIVGSHSYGCCLGPNLTVDLNINIPNEALNKNDYVNERYHRKRALYLSFIAEKLYDSNLVQEMKFKSFNGSNLKPVLMLKPWGKIGEHVNVTIQISIDKEYFKLSRFNPSRNNVRADWRFKKEDKDSLSFPTPFYNTAFLQDLTLVINNEFLVKTIGKSDNIKCAILLLKVWVKQRQIFDLSGFIIAMFVSYLVKIKRINNAMSSYQLTRNIWTALAASEWDNNGISLFTEEHSTHYPPITEFHTFFPVVFVDCSGYHNICAHLSLDIYNTIKHESQLALHFLDNRNINGFLPLFMVPVNFYHKFDHVLRIENTRKLQKIVSQYLDEHTKLDLGTDTYFAVGKYLSDLIRKGLGKRISIVSIKSLSDDDLSWPVDFSVKNANHYRKPYIFGLKLNPEHAFSTVDVGPEANLPQAEIFRKFWGEKSELRRFQDGSISEACIWKTAATMADKRLIVKQIICYLLQTKLGIEKGIFYMADQLDFALKNQRFEPTNFEYGTGEEASSKVNLSFDALMKNLRSLTEIPLDINSIHGISSVFSYTDPIPPLAYAPISTKGFTSCEKYRLIRDGVRQGKLRNCDRPDIVSPLYIPTLHVVIQLSESGKWPDDVEAFKRVKAAFNIEIGEALKKQYGLTTHSWYNFVDVMMDGYVFRIEIGHRKEISLMKKIVDKGGVIKLVDSDQSLDKEYRLMYLPRLRIALNGLHLQNMCYGPSVCLLKRWIRSHMIDCHHLPDICTEMLMAHVFMSPQPLEVPNQPQVAFFRALFILASYDWNTQMILLNFNNDLNSEDLMEIESNFNTNRSTLPALYLVTPYEGKRISHWSRTAPSYQILARLQILATEALNIINTVVFNNLSDDVCVLFKPNLEGFDVLIYLEPLLNPLSYLNMSTSHKNTKIKCKAYEKTNDELFPVVDFDPVQIYLDHLRSSYDDFALFFHDSYGGDVIGVLWKPSALEFKEFKASSVNGRKTFRQDGKEGLLVDLDSILEGFIILGDGLVKDIQNNTNLFK